MFHNTQSLRPGRGFEPTDIPTTRMDEREAAFGDTQPEAGTALGPSLAQDLRRLGAAPTAADLPAVLAASLRHGAPLDLSLELDGTPLTLSLSPRHQAYGCDLDPCALADETLLRLKLLHVQPAAAARAREAAPPSGPHTGPLRELMWHFAMRGAHGGLLPEMAGPVRCRMAPGQAPIGLPIDGARQHIVRRMQQAAVSLDELLVDTILGRAAVERLWNALYLQSALMVSRAFSQ